MEELNEHQLLEKFGEMSRVLRHVPGMAVDEVAQRIVHLHQKHAREVSAVVNAALSRHSADLLSGKLSSRCVIVLALPPEYKTSEPPSLLPERKPQAPVPKPPAWNKHPYSTRDESVFKAVGDDNFRVLTNEEIEKRFRPHLKPLIGREYTPDALRACLNRIRRHNGLQLSKDIRKNPVKA